MHCPYCDYSFDSHVGIGPQKRLKPIAGDICLCMSCGKISRVDNEGNARKMTLSEEFSAWCDNTMVSNLASTIQEFTRLRMRTRKRKP